MKLPNMPYGDRIRKRTKIKFGGLNRTEGAADGEMRDMRNLTSDHWPLLAVRGPRRQCGMVENPGGIFSWEGLAWVEGTNFVFRGEVKGRVTEGEKQFASIGAYIVIFPDKCWYNVDTGEFGKMEAVWSGENVTFRGGTLYEENAKCNTIQVEGVRWEEYFCEGDAVRITGCKTVTENNVTIVIREIRGDSLVFYENSFTMIDGQDNYTEPGNLEIRRAVPDLKFLCENDNRLWGCTDREIFACKLGDIFNWNVYDGVSTDSYTVDTGSSGKFTGCVSYMGHPIFFKEDHIYKIYGSLPSNYEVVGSASLGLMEGAEKSLAVAGETLFYLSRSGIMAYTGGIPHPISAALGNGILSDAVAGSDGLKYYVSMKRLGEGHGLYVYDTQRGLWHREDDTQAIGFARYGGELYMMEHNGVLWSLNGQREADGLEAKIPWEAEFVDFTEDEPNSKTVSKIQIRMTLEDGARIAVKIMYDSDGCWERVAEILGEGEKRSYYLPIIPRRADHYRLKLSGVGGCMIQSLALERYVGSAYKTREG